MRIKIDTTSITKDGDKIFGEIYFKDYPSFYFPSKDWNDFLVVILNWWCDTIIRLLRNESIQDDFSFMDGPFNVKVGHIKEGMLNLTFLSGDETVVKTSEVPMNDFLNAYLSEINGLLRWVAKKNWQNQEIETLESNYRKIQTLLKTLRIDIS
ncbi:hypothetical protein KIM67_18320 [Flagellimonas sp. 389]|uniref:hypothetical protein n=1 Tax=Flagellimonas sp. 389 TaxID=2835862 RepID=UPI001BD28DDD|nr:hypothetical protein [Flagellimonas sp. 389]MBS9464383.1 hypothetical protein [Flagellimonas sp. 389]